jgi:hypothetical protein
MKAGILFYIISLIVFAGVIFMIVEYRSSQVEMLAGGLTMIGFSLNIAGYLMKKKSVVYRKG